MAIEYWAKLLYQADEEVLQSELLFVDDEDKVSNRTQICKDLAGGLIQGIDVCGEHLGDLWQFWAVEVTSPSVGPLGIGPARFIQHRNEQFSEGIAMMAPDSVVANVQFSGLDNAGKQAVGGMRLSGIPLSYVTCNAFTQGVTNDLAAAIDTLIINPYVIPSLDVALRHAVKRSKDVGGGLYAYVNQISINPVPGYRLDRVGNRSNNGRKRQAANGDPQTPVTP